MFAGHRIYVAYFLRKGKAVVKRMLKVDEHHILFGLLWAWLRFYSRNEQFVKRSITLKKIGEFPARQVGGMEKFFNGGIHLKRRVIHRVKKRSQFAFDNI